MDILQKCAETLVESGYAEKIWLNMYSDSQWLCDITDKKCIDPVIISPFADTLEGRRQADAIEDWLKGVEVRGFWQKSANYKNVSQQENNHQWRLDRIKWCIAELIK